MSVEQKSLTKMPYTNKELLAIVIWALTGIEPTNEKYLNSSDIHLCELDLHRFFSEYAGVELQVFLERGLLGILDLAVIASLIASPKWDFYSSVLSVEDCCAVYYDMQKRQTLRNIRNAIQLGLVYQRRLEDESYKKPNQTLYRILARLFMLIQRKSNDAEERRIVPVFEEFFHAEAVTAQSDLICLIFSWRYLANAVKTTGFASTLGSFRQDYPEHVSQRMLQTFFEHQLEYSYQLVEQQGQVAKLIREPNRLAKTYKQILGSGMIQTEHGHYFL